MCSLGKVSADELEYESPVEKANKYIGSNWRLLNRNLDSFFSNDLNETKENDGQIKAYITFYHKERVGLDTDFDIQLKVDLPKTTKKLKLVIEKEQDDISNALSDENFPQGKNDKIKKREGYSAGLDYLLSESKNFRSSFQFGFRLTMPLNPSVKFDLNKDYNLKHIKLSLFQKFIYYRQEGFQHISQAVISKNWSERFQTDLINSIAWTDEDDEFIIRNNLINYYKISDHKTLSLSLGAIAMLSPHYYYDRYDISLNFRNQFIYEWLYLTSSIGSDFLKEHNFKRELFGQLRFEIFFE